MPKQWLSLPEAEQLAVDFTGSDVAGARDQILEGIRNREIHTSGRGPNVLPISSLPGEAWSQEPDWETSHLRWSPRRLYGERFGRVIVGRIDRRTLERYLAPAALVPATPASPRHFSPPIETRGRKRKYDWDAAWAEAVRVADFDGLPDRDSFRKQIREWFTQHDEDGGPSDTQINDFVVKVYARIPDR